jgi:GntR family transcriptional regulator
MAIPLDRNSWEPLYYQIAERIRAKVENELTPGRQIPSENELINEYNVSRNTVRLAIDTLIKQGMVYRVKGKGTFVAPERLKSGLTRLTSFTEECWRMGMQPSSRLLNLQRIVPPLKIRQALQVAADQQVFIIERQRFADEKPLALNASYLPCALFPTLDQEDLTHGSVYRVIEDKYRMPIGYASQVLKPVVATEVEANLLEVEKGSPLLQVEGVAYLIDGTPFEYARLIYRGDRYEFPIQALRHPPVDSRNNSDNSEES